MPFDRAGTARLKELLGAFAVFAVGGHWALKALASRREAATNRNRRSALMAFEYCDRGQRGVKCPPAFVGYVMSDNWYYVKLASVKRSYDLDFPCGELQMTVPQRREITADEVEEEIARDEEYARAHPEVDMQAAIARKK